MEYSLTYQIEFSKQELFFEAIRNIGVSCEMDAFSYGKGNKVYARTLIFKDEADRIFAKFALAAFEEDRKK